MIFKIGFGDRIYSSGKNIPAKFAYENSQRYIDKNSQTKIFGELKKVLDVQ